MSTEGLAMIFAALILVFLLIPRKSRYRNYDDYLHSGVWKKLSSKARARDGYRCRTCNRSGDLEVHHRRYPKYLGTESVNDLTTLCRDCHRKISR